MLQKTALIINDASRYVVYFPQPKISRKALTPVRTAVLSFVDTVFKGATIYKKTVYESEGRYEGEGETTYVLEILLQDIPDKEVRIEQLGWIILCYLDNLRSERGKGRERTVWYYTHPVSLYRLDNPDIVKSQKGGEHSIAESK